MAHQDLLTPVSWASCRTGRLRVGVRIVCRKAFKSGYGQQLSVGSHKNGEQFDHGGCHLRSGKLQGVQRAQRMFGYQQLCPYKYILAQGDNSILSPNMKQKAESETVKIGCRHVAFPLSPG
jgi:hypothetical protein